MLGKEKLQVKQKVNKLGYSQCALPQVCVSAQAGSECRVHVDKRVSGHVIVYVWSPSLSVSEWADMDLSCVPMPP